jgi:hypothetical protein
VFTPPPEEDASKVRKWADYLFSISSDECWLDAAALKRLLHQRADELQQKEEERQQEMRRLKVAEL